ncbi:MAG: ABC transporter ATP-binding protein [Candidatus Goldiibacteriota bacterium]
MLEIKDLSVEINNKPVLKDINMSIPDGETHILFGPNGSGKTSLLMTIMGYPAFKITSGGIFYNGKPVNDMKIDERSKNGFGMFFQRPPTIKGIKLKELAEIIKKNSGTQLDLKTAASALNLEKLLDRDINQGLSGGEIKRSEFLQLYAQNPDFVMLDEPESGVDVENLNLLGNKIKMLLGRGLEKDKRKKSALIITHTGHILNYVDADLGHTIIDGEIRCTHKPEMLFKHIQKHGFKECGICGGKK